MASYPAILPATTTKSGTKRQNILGQSFFLPISGLCPDCAEAPMERHGSLALAAESNSDTHSCARTYQRRHISHITLPTITGVLPEKCWVCIQPVFLIPLRRLSDVEETTISMGLGRTTWRPLNVRGEVS